MFTVSQGERRPAAFVAATDEVERIFHVDSWTAGFIARGRLFSADRSNMEWFARC